MHFFFNSPSHNLPDKCQSKSSILIVNIISSDSNKWVLQFFSKINSVVAIFDSLHHSTDSREGSSIYTLPVDDARLDDVFQLEEDVAVDKITWILFDHDFY